MVNWPKSLWVVGAACFLAQQTPQSALQRMLPKERAAVLAALAAFIILGLGLIALIWLGARVTRRYMNQQPLRPLDFNQIQDDWSNKPLVPPPASPGEDPAAPDEGDDA